MSRSKIIVNIVNEVQNPDGKYIHQSLGVWLIVNSEILAGDVYFSNNNRLCYVSTINWQDILSGDGARVEFYDDDKENKTLCTYAQPWFSCGYSMLDQATVWKIWWDKVKSFLKCLLAQQLVREGV